VSSTGVTHENQHVLGPISSNLHQLHGPVLVIIVLALVRAPPLAVPANAPIIPSNSLEHLLRYRLPRRRHGDHHIRRPSVRSPNQPTNSLTFANTQLETNGQTPFPATGNGKSSGRESQRKTEEKTQEFDGGEGVLGQGGNVMAYMLCVCVLWCVRFGQPELAIYVLVLVNTEVGCLELFWEFKGIGGIL
jgi:hypothetical protein